MCTHCTSTYLPPQLLHLSLVRGDVGHKPAILNDQSGDGDEGEGDHLELVPSLPRLTDGIETAAPGPHRHQGGGFCGRGGHIALFAVFVLVVAVKVIEEKRKKMWGAGNEI